MENTAKTPTLVSTVQMTIWWWACCVACHTCSRIRLSASSWVHGAWVLTSFYSGAPSIPFPSVRTTSLSSLQNTRRRTLDWNLNSSVLLLSTRRKFSQYPGTAAFPTTRLLAPFHTWLLLYLSRSPVVMTGHSGMSECHSWYQVVIFLHRRELEAMLGSHAERSLPDCHPSFNS